MIVFILLFYTEIIYLLKERKSLQGVVEKSRRLVDNIFPKLHNANMPLMAEQENDFSHAE
jgi:hypothetical protein